MVPHTTDRCRHKGLGFLMTISLYSLDTAMMFSAVLCTAMVSVLFYWAICMAESFSGPRKQQKEGMQEWSRG
jgi:ABC-type nitrate/sulfonate/bicarbonate transport system permease component